MSRSDDPRLTAYALGEDELEFGEVGEVGEGAPDSIEQRVAESEALRREVAEIRATARLLSAALGAEPAPSLTPEQRRAVQEAARRASAPARPAWALPATAGLAAAALLLGVAFVWTHRPPQRGEGPRSADAPLNRSTPAATSSSPVNGATPTAAAEALRDSRSTAARRDAGGARRPRRRAAAPVTVEGVVQDETGAPIPGATVVVRSPAEGVERSAVSNERGQFQVTAAPSGHLDLRAELDGFVTTHARAAPPPGSSVRWNPALRVGTLAEITVVQELPALNAPSNFADAGERRRAEAAGGATARAEATAKTAARRDDDFLDATAHPIATLRRDASSASYDDLRRFLNRGELPPPEAVQVDEMIGAFAFEPPPPRGRQPVAAALEIGPAPWATTHRLLRIGVAGPHVEVEVRFNPLLVDAYRPIGHSNRPVTPAAPDRADADGGHSLTALYEIVPASERTLAMEPRIEVFRYQKPAELAGSRSGELLRLTVRYRAASGRTEEWTLRDPPVRREPSAEFQFAASVAAFGMLLRGAPHQGGADDLALRLAEEGRGPDPAGERAEFIELVKKAAELWREAAGRPPR
jgi:hypothetical protein